ncbi:CHAT domain-containing protein [Angustibacter luteus]|uniref:CHAT domain-containing protein n=1 Tax=Angustibacter luteus TaxID=658456 RepID=A0ABW1JBM5_9ACTN
MTDRPPINVRETRAMTGFLRDAVEAGSEQERDAALDAGIVAWGREFVDLLRFAAGEAPDPWQPVLDAGLTRLLRWLGGAVLTARADEDERRAIVALEVAELTPALARLAVEALRRLPAGHPLRREHLDVALARARRHLVDPQTDDEVEGRLLTLGSLIDQDPDGEDVDDLVAEGERLLPRGRDPFSRRAFRMAAGAVFMGRLIASRDAEDRAGVTDAARRVHELLDPVVEGLTEAGDATALPLAALAYELDDDEGAALDLYLRALDGEHAEALTEEQRLTALTAVLRTGVLVGRHEPVTAFARETLGRLVFRYATEPDPQRAGEQREAVDAALANIGSACAATGDLDLLLWALETTSSARLRYRRAIRQGRSAASIRKLEAALWSAERGTGGTGSSGGGSGDRELRREGRAARQVTAVARLREAHRREALRHRRELAVPTADEVSGRLRRGEGVAVLGAGRWGTAVLLLEGAGPPDGEAVGGGVLDEPLHAWANTLGSDDPAGWAYAVGLPWAFDTLAGADRRAALERALAKADEQVGRLLLAWSGERGLDRVWLVPHGILGLLPWWAVPSLRGLDVRQVACLAMLPSARGAAQLRGPAVVVGNATGDLPAASAEAGSVAARLRARGVPVADLPVDECTEDGVAAAVSGARLLHFCGHATSEMTDSARSALHVRPDPRWSGPSVLEELDRLVAGASWRGEPDEARSAEVRLDDGTGPPLPGLLREEDVGGGVTLRHLEHGPAGTLQAVYVGDRLVRLAELWSAGDMAVSGALRDVRLAVLSACQSGGGALSLGSDELGGLPAAMLLAGVRSIVCTAWTVDDVLAAVSADLLWELLCAQPSGLVDLYVLVGEVRDRLAQLSRDDAARRIGDLRAAAPDGRTRFRLEAAAAGLAPGRPFARPFEWAPLYVVGEPLVRWRPAS